jgi:cobalt/nickel transport system permease protein
MHMSDALITPVVGGSMMAASSGVMGYSIRSLKKEIFEKRLPLMGVMGAFLFAAQMINFAIPGTGSSGHIGGGILLAIVLGPAASFLTMACVLLIQALFFADGGLLAYGCNLINLGFFSAFVAYPLIFKPIVKNNLNRKTIMVASIAASVIGLQLGSLGVVFETIVSGRTEIPLSAFLIFMQFIHLAIGVAEGVVTGVIINYLYSQNKQMIFMKIEEPKESRKWNKNIILKIAVLTIIIAGILSLFASVKPDGLEWAIQKTAVVKEQSNDSTIATWLDTVQKKTAIFPEYELKAEESKIAVGTSIPGIVGSIVTLCVTLVVGGVIRKRRKHAELYE